VTDINKANKEGDTALHYAARNGREAVVLLLLSHRANTLAMGKHGDPAEVHTRTRTRNISILHFTNNNTRRWHGKPDTKRWRS
jgi:ankyrin repeat protein